ncbi:hypothetical protein HWV62_2478 [Athelia sp. TMB]|nr:hypothetical protein HWV62_2478 [Athelia sp. TMB]
MELIRNSASTEVAGDLFWIFTLLLRQSARSSDRDTMATLASAGALSTLEHYRARIGLALADVMAWDEILCSLPVISTETISRTALTQSLFDEMQNQDEEEAEMTRSIREPLLQFSPSMQPSVSLREQETSGVMGGIRNMMTPISHQRPMPSLPAVPNVWLSDDEFLRIRIPCCKFSSTFAKIRLLAVESTAPLPTYGKLFDGNSTVLSSPLFKLRIANSALEPFLNRQLPIGQFTLGPRSRYKFPVGQSSFLWRSYDKLLFGKSVFTSLSKKSKSFFVSDSTNRYSNSVLAHEWKRACRIAHRPTVAHRVVRIRTFHITKLARAFASWRSAFPAAFSRRQSSASECCG